VGTVSINKKEVMSIPIPVVSQELQDEVETRYRDVLYQYRLAINRGEDERECLGNLETVTHYLETELLGQVKSHFR